MNRFDGPRLHYRLIGSTNDRARELAEAGAPRGTVITASEQTAGRGRRGRRWAAPPDTALLCSAILRPLEARHALLPLAVPLAVCHAAEALTPVRCEVKWPNDVWVEQRKLAGVLIEARPPDWAVIGVGLNLAVPDDQLPADLRWPATSLGHGIGVGEALAALREGLGKWVDAMPDEVVAAFRERDALRGREVEWEGAGGSSGSGSGRGAGIDDRGNLIVETHSGETVSLGAGEVQLRLAQTNVDFGAM